MNVSFSQTITEFTSLKYSISLSENTSKRYEHVMRAFVEYLGNTPIDKITFNHVLKYKLQRFKDGCKISTVNHEMGILRAYFRFLNDCYPTASSVTPKQIDFTKGPENEVILPTAEEVERLINAPNINTLLGKRDRAILSLFRSSGVRVAELVSLNKKTDFSRREFSVVGKGSKRRTVPCSDKSICDINMYLAARGKDHYSALFISFSNPAEEARLSCVSIQDIVRRYARDAGITKRITPHTLRHFFATDLLKKGVNIRIVQEKLGHSSITTTALYLNMMNDYTKKILDEALN